MSVLKGAKAKFMLNGEVIATGVVGETVDITSMRPGIATHMGSLGFNKPCNGCGQTFWLCSDPKETRCLDCIEKDEFAEGMAKCKLPFEVP